MIFFRYRLTRKTAAPSFRTTAYQERLTVKETGRKSEWVNPRLSVQLPFSQPLLLFFPPAGQCVSQGEPPEQTLSNKNGRMNMKRSIAATVLATLAGLAAVSPARADGWEHHHGHGHGHHHHGPHWAHEHYYPKPAYYGPPPVVHHYHPPQVVYREAPAYQPPHRGISEIVPLAAGGIIGGVVGDQAGQGNPAAIIGGSVLGSVLGHEIAR
jgi:hypothetical protein